MSKFTLKIDVEIDNLSEEGLDVVVAKLMGGKEGRYSSDWSLMGPIIEKLGIELVFSDLPEEDPDSPTAKLMARLGQEQERWSAQYKDAYETASRPLIAIAKALIRSKFDDLSIPLDAESAIGLLKDSSPIRDILIEGTDAHECHELRDKPNTYCFTPKIDLESFQTIARIIQSIADFKILSEKTESKNGQSFLAEVTARYYPARLKA